MSQNSSKKQKRLARKLAREEKRQNGQGFSSADKLPVKQAENLPAQKVETAPAKPRETVREITVNLANLVDRETAIKRLVVSIGLLTLDRLDENPDMHNLAIWTCQQMALESYKSNDAEFQASLPAYFSALAEFGIADILMKADQSFVGFAL